jgi:hypothetical protein
VFIVLIVIVTGIVVIIGGRVIGFGHGVILGITFAERKPLFTAATRGAPAIATRSATRTAVEYFQPATILTVFELSVVRDEQQFVTTPLERSQRYCGRDFSRTSRNSGVCFGGRHGSSRRSEAAINNNNSNSNVVWFYRAYRQQQRSVKGWQHLLQRVHIISAEGDVRL